MSTAASSLANERICSFVKVAASWIFSSLVPNFSTTYSDNSFKYFDLKAIGLKKGDSSNSSAAPSPTVTYSKSALKSIFPSIVNLATNSANSAFFWMNSKLTNLLGLSPTSSSAAAAASPLRAAIWASVYFPVAISLALIPAS